MKRELNIWKAIICLVLLASMIICLVACQNHGGEHKPELAATAIEHETKYGGVYIKITVEDFNALGFEYGDSLNITFSNGFELKDLPYYNGFYVDMGEPLLVGYPGYPYIRVGYNDGEDMFVKAELSDTDTATIELATKGKYLDIQESMDIYYSDEQGDRPDAVFANFRVVNVGNLKQNILYRSASPADNQHKRAAVTDRLAKEAGIAYIINLSDNAEELAEHIAADDFDSPYFLSLYNNGKVIPLSMSMAFESDDFAQKLVVGLTAASKEEGPYLVHCVEGKDRTGYVCMVMEALAGATYEEMVADYMVTYDNYYGINQTKEPTKYKIIKEKNIDVMLQYLSGFGEMELESADYAYCARTYLISIGMTEADVDALTARLVGDQT